MAKFEGIQNVVLAVGRLSPSGIQLLGTAFSLDKTGFFATASHVAGNDDTGLVLAFKIIKSFDDYQDTTDSSVKTFPVKIVASDPFHDIAVLKGEVNIISNLIVASSDDAPVGTHISSFGYPHADHGRMVLTQQDTEVGARVLISSGKIKAKHLILNTQTRPGQSGSPVFLHESKALVAVLVGTYAPSGGGGISLGGVDPHTLHQTTHAVSAEYLKGMY